MNNVTEYVIEFFVGNDPNAECLNDVKPVNCRVNLGRFYQLKLIAEKLKMSNTRCAENLLHQAIVDAIQALNIDCNSEEYLDGLRAFLCELDNQK
jgi:hypothetical protein